MKYILEKKSISQVTRTPKYGGGFSRDLFDWMRTGVLAEMVAGMQRPDFLSLADFETSGATRIGLPGTCSIMICL